MWTSDIHIGIVRDESKFEYTKKLICWQSREYNGHSRSDVITGAVKLGFSFNPTREVWLMSAPYFALQLSTWLYPELKEIHLWGIDLEGAKFYDSKWEIAPGEVKRQNEEFVFARKALAAKGICVLNHSKGKGCTAFERAE
jgi:hypothetical protein